VNEAIVFELDVHRDFAHYYVDVHSINTSIRVKSAFYCDYNCDYNFVNNFYFVNNLIFDLYNY